MNSSICKSSGAPPPPPPFSLLSIASKKKSDSDVLMKKVNWDKIEPQKLSKDCLWSKEKQATSKHELITEEIKARLVENFSSKPAKQRNFSTKPVISSRVIDAKSAHTLLMIPDDSSRSFQRHNT